MKLDEILNSQKAPAPVASTVIPVTKKSGTLRLSDILSQEPSAPSPVQEIAPAQIPQAVAPVKPTFKTYKDLTLKQKAKAGLDRLGLNVGASIGGVIASTVEAFSTGKDVIKGAVTGSTISEELAKDSAYDKVVKDIAKNIQTYTQDSMKNTLTQKKIELGLDPNDTFTDQALGGLGSFMGFVGPGMASKALVTTLGFVKYAPTVTSSLNIANESIVESQDVYKEEKEKGKSDQEAYESFRNTLAGNALLIGVSNKLGGMFDNTTFTGLKRAFKAGFAGFMEGSQEAIQKIVSNVNTGKPWSLGVKDSFIIGAILGAPANLALDTGDKTKKEAVKEEIAQMDIADDKKQLAIDVIDGVATEEQKAKVVTELIANTESNVPVDETNKTNLQEDIKSMVEQGANVGDIVLALQEEGISQNDAENLVAEILANQQQQAETSTTEVPVEGGIASPEIKTLDEEAKKYKSADEFIASQGSPLYHGSKNIKDINKNGFSLSNAKAGVKFGDEAGIYLSNDISRSKEYGDVGEFYLKPNLKIAKITNDEIMSDAFGEQQKFKDGNINKYFKEQGYDGVTITGKKGQALGEGKIETIIFDPNNIKTKSQLTDIYNKTKKVDEQMAQDARGDGAEFKTREATGTREMAVLDDFKKRYKVQFPTLIVDKIIQGKKTKLHPKGDGTAEGATDGNTIAIAFDAVANTGKHEIVHLTLNNLDQIPELAKFSREDILKAQAKKMGVVYDAKKESEDGGLIEEQLALDIELYENKQYKPNDTILAKFFASIDKMLKNFRSLIVKSNGDVITEYYDAILYGESKRAQEVAITTKSKVARYLIDNILDYRPMYQASREMSLSNGITSVDFKTTKEVDPLLEEAKKYKSAEEFVKAQPTELNYKNLQENEYSIKAYGKDFNEPVEYFRAGQVRKNGDIWLTDNEAGALQYSKAGGGTKVDSYIVQSKNPLIIDTAGGKYANGNIDINKILTKDEIAQGYTNNPDIKKKFIDYAKNNGYDAVQFSDSFPDGEGGMRSLVVWDKNALRTKSQLTDIWNKAQEDKSQPKFKEALDKSLEVYKESGDLTTKILKDLEGKTTVSKQYILDATNRGDVKQVEKDLIRSIVSTEGDKVNVKDFAERVKLELLPLTIKGGREDLGRYKYEFVNLPTELRGKVANYNEHIYESPIETSAGNVHFSGDTNNYFGHTRLEDMAGGDIRRVIEVQSDLYQKGNLERETPAKLRNLLKINNEEINSKARIDEYGFEIGNTPSKERIAELEANNKEIESQLRDVGRLDQYNDPTAHFRMIREEIRKATQDGKSVLQFPTGSTAMRIEGLGSVNQWGDRELSNRLVDENPSIGLSRLQREARLTPENLKVGKEVNDGGNDWIITDVLGDGKFKAVPKELAISGGTVEEFIADLPNKPQYITNLVETFDISGKVDTNNPIYKFYEKEVGRYLKNNYAAETVTDDKGVTWYEVKLKDEYKGAVVAFKERVSRAENEEYIKKTYPKYYAMTRKLLEEAKTKPVSPQAKQGIRSVAKRVEERAKTLGVTVDESYEIKRFVTEVATSEVILENNKDKIEDILNGSFPYPTDVSKTAFLHTIIEDAKARNDTRTLTKAYNRLAEEATVAGQDIAFINSVYKMYDETSPETYLNKIKAERETMDMQKTWSIKNPFAGKDVREKIVRKRTERQKAIRLGVKERTTIKIQELESILDSFVC